MPLFRRTEEDEENITWLECAAPRSWLYPDRFGLATIRLVMLQTLLLVKSWVDDRSERWIPRYHSFLPSCLALKLLYVEWLDRFWCHNRRIIYLAKEAAKIQEASPPRPLKSHMLLALLAGEMMFNKGFHQPSTWTCSHSCFLWKILTSRPSIEPVFELMHTERSFRLNGWRHQRNSQLISCGVVAEQ